MTGFSITPLKYNGEVTTYRIQARRSDGTLFVDFGATPQLALGFGLRACNGEETRDPHAIARKLAVVAA